jgi:hypothetical protein
MFIIVLAIKGHVKAWEDCLISEVAAIAQAAPTNKVNLNE